ncbi:phage tailspike polysaccharide lyase family protein [Acinetobacter courvalinii]|uniref:phage tailspike polysaccharide lyase family protein n=1 Tax=Acinetobacter courvalinii TaxID=280147 RepID=UPI00289FCB0A|nr:hypothetical protein [Acinetobacter courvalinii]
MATVNATDVIDGSENQKQINDKTIQNILSINLLRVFVKRINGQIVNLKSYHEGVNAGGGIFYADELDTTSVDNGVTTILGSDGTRWKRNKKELTFADAGCLGSGDETLKIQALLNIAINNDYVINDNSGKRFTFTQNIIISAPNRSLKISGDFELFSLDKMISINGAMENVSNISSEAKLGEFSIILSDTSNILPGDILILHNTIESSFSAHRSYYCDGEFVKVRSVSANLLTLEEALLTDYPAALTSKVFKISPAHVEIEGGNFIAGGKYALHLSLCYSSTISPSKVVNELASTSAFGALIIEKCLDISILGGYYFKKFNAGSGTDYGISISNSQNIRINNVNAFGGRHAIAAGGSGTDGAVPCRFVEISSSYLTNDPASKVHCADFHGNTIDSYYMNCRISGGITLSGERCYSLKNVISKYDNDYVAAPIGWAEVVGDIGFFNDTVLNCGAANRVAGSPSSSYFPFIQKPYKITVEGLTAYIAPTVTSIMIAYDNSGQENSFILKDFEIKGNSSGLTSLMNYSIGANAIKAKYLEVSGARQKPEDAINPLAANMAILQGVHKKLFSYNGSNANGKWFRQEDGSQICTQTITINTAIDSSFLGGFKSSDIGWNFPKSFIGNPTITVTPINGTSVGGLSNSVTASSANIALLAFTSQAISTRQFNVTATGKWIND